MTAQKKMDELSQYEAPISTAAGDSQARLSTRQFSSYKNDNKFVTTSAMKNQKGKFLAVSSLSSSH